MGFTLIHGPSGAGKSRHILKQIAQQSLQNCKIVLPNQLLIDDYQKNLIEHSQRAGLLNNQGLISFDDFLLSILKQNKPRVHHVRPVFTRNVVRRLLFQSKNSIYRNFLRFPVLVDELASLLVRLGQCGFNSSKAALYFKNKTSIQPLLGLLKEYEAFMLNHDLYDTGLLLAHTLESLDSPEFKWLDAVQTLVVDRFYPLLPGQRELFFKLNQKLPDLDIIISYSFDYTQNDSGFFDYSYNALGEMAASQEYFHLTKNKSVPVIKTTSTPAFEINLLIDHIKKLLIQGVKPSLITIVLPYENNYHTRLNHLLSINDIPYSSYFSQPLEDQSTKDLEQVLTHWREYPSSKTQESLIKLKAREVFKQEWDFMASLLFDDPKLKEASSQWEQEEKTAQKYLLQNKSNGVKIVPLALAATLNTHYLFVAGYSESSSCASGIEAQILPTHEISQPEMREVFQAHSYRLQLEQKNWEDLLSRNEGVVTITYSLYDWNGQQTILPQHLLVQYPDHVFCDVPDKSLPENKSLTPKHFPPKTQNSFSITELETYLKCPFQYYAKHTLKLPEANPDTVDIRGDVSGRLIHKALDELYGQNQDLFQEACEYDLYLKRFKGLIRPLMSELINNDFYFKQYPVTIKEDYLERAITSLEKMVDQEIGFIRKGTKKTHPYLFEWAFGKGSTPALKIQNDDLFISITGRIDRIDLNKQEKIFSVIDYKTGELPSGVSIRDGLSLQIPLYMMAVKQILLPDHTPSSGLLMGLKEIGKNTGLVLDGLGEENLLWRTCKISTDAWDELAKKTESLVINTATLINDGEFSPKPDSSETCKRCSFDSLCHYKSNTNEVALS